MINQLALIKPHIIKKNLKWMRLGLLSILMHQSWIMVMHLLVIEEVKRVICRKEENQRLQHSSVDPTVNTERELKQRDKLKNKNRQLMNSCKLISKY
jgi:hypothetical protein